MKLEVLIENLKASAEIKHFIANFGSMEDLKYIEADDLHAEFPDLKIGTARRIIATIHATIMMHELKQITKELRKSLKIRKRKSFT